MDEPLPTTEHFEDRMRDRPEIRREWCELAVRQPLQVQVQENGNIRHWIYIMELDKYIRVVTLPDGTTLHTAFPDHHFRG